MHQPDRLLDLVWQVHCRLMRPQAPNRVLLPRCGLVFPSPLPFSISRHPEYLPTVRLVQLEPLAVGPRPALVVEAVAQSQKASAEVEAAQILEVEVVEAVQSQREAVVPLWALEEVEVVRCS